MSKFPMTLTFIDPSHTDDDGNLYPGDLGPVEGYEWCSSPDECEHTYTACRECILDWMSDYRGVIHAPSADVSFEQIIAFKTMSDNVQRFIHAWKGIFHDYTNDTSDD